MSVLRCRANAACNRAVFGHGVANTETYHAVVAFLVAWFGKFFCDNFKCIPAVEVVSVDYCKRFLDSILAHENGMVGSPGFCAVFGACIALGERVE